MKSFDESKESSYIIYIDCNNLYGYSMMQHLPINGFKWSDREFTAERILNMGDDDAKGYMFEVDLDYPDSLHDLHNDYPFCAENMPVPERNGERSSKQEELLLTLSEKKNYVIHYRMLKLALRHGLILRKVHRALEFNQSPWLRCEQKR